MCAAGAKKLTAACTVQRDLTGSLIRCARAQFDHLEISAADLTYYQTKDEAQLVDAHLAVERRDHPRVGLSLPGDFSIPEVFQPFLSLPAGIGGFLPWVFLPISLHSSYEGFFDMGFPSHALHSSYEGFFDMGFPSHALHSSYEGFFYTMGFPSHALHSSYEGFVAWVFLPTCQNMPMSLHPKWQLAVSLLWQLGW